MNLTLREAATLLGRSGRTLRDQVARGDIRGIKEKGAWVIPSDALPLTQAQRRALQARAEEIRSAVEDVLPSRMATDRAAKARSLADVEAFRKARGVSRAMKAASASPMAIADLEEGLLLLAEGNASFDRDMKVVALRGARARLGRVVGRLLLDADDLPAEPVHGWIRILEGEVLPLLAGLCRWAEHLPRRSP